MLPVVFAVILACGDLCDPAAVDHYRQLLDAGGYGRLQLERGAFLIRESDGTLTLEPWPNAGLREVSFRGAIPRGTIAVIHTHPLSSRNPSAQDRLMAERLGLPVVVITPHSVTAAFPDATVRALTTSRRWWK